MAFAHPEWLVDVAWLSEHLDDDDVRVVECPWDAAAYSRAHIPGAVLRPGHPYVKGLDENGDPTVHAPSADAVAEMCRTMGIGAETDVIVYDDWGTLFATRLWWVLRLYGFERVRVLDGGWQAWAAAGHPISFAVPDVPEVEPPELVLDPARVIGVDELIAVHADDSVQVVDVRSDDEHHGRSDRGNARAGRLPGATHIEWNRFLENSTDSRAVRTLRSEAEVRALVEAAALDPGKTVVTHCQAAVRATHTAFVLEMLGFPPVRVYDGSAEEWANRDDTPLE